MCSSCQENEDEQSNSDILPPGALLSRVPLLDLLIKRSRWGQWEGILCFGSEWESRVQASICRGHTDYLMHSLLHQLHSGHLQSSGAMRSNADGSKWEVNVYSLLSLDKQARLLSIVTKAPRYLHKNHFKPDTFSWIIAISYKVLLLGNQHSSSFIS